MALSSIIDQIVLEDPKEIESFLNAIEESKRISKNTVAENKIRFATKEETVQMFNKRKNR